ncbi:MAG TPA: serine hydrolase domain-containing protein, partial [Flavisolibacter sp.]|nr:serine hydrolase domain-containing protein [Flavisolibacter sp.]
MRKTFVFLFCLSLFLQGISQQPSAALTRFIQQKGDSVFKAEDFPGLFIGVLNKGQRQYLGFGYAVPDEKTAFDSTTVFEAGSITKTFTAFIVESVLQEKGIADTAAVISYLPTEVRTNKALAGITFASLLNHTSGLPRLPENMKPANELAPYDDYTANNLFAYLTTAKTPTA